MSNVRLQGRPPKGCSCRRGRLFNGACATCRAAARAKGVVLLTPRQFQREKEERQELEALAARLKRDTRRAKKAAAKAEAKARAALREERRKMKDKPKDPAVIFFEKHTPTILKEATPVSPRGEGILVVDSRGRVTDMKPDHVMTENPPPETGGLRECPNCHHHVKPKNDGASTAVCPECRFWGKRWRFR